MPMSMQIIPELALVYARYSGVARVTEGVSGFTEYVSHPDYHPGQKQLIDLTTVESVVADHPAVIKLQALKAKYFRHSPGQPMVCFLAPTAIGREMAAMAMRSWEGMDHIVMRIFEEEEAALDFLGLPAKSIAELLARKQPAINRPISP